MIETKQCYWCKKVLPVTEFGNNRKHNDGLQSYCKPCKRIYDSTWRKKNRKYVNWYYRKYMRNKRLQKQSETNFLNGYLQDQNDMV